MFYYEFFFFEKDSFISLLLWQLDLFDKAEGGIRSHARFKLVWKWNKRTWQFTISEHLRLVPNYVLTGFCELEAKIYLISVTLDKLLPVTGTADDELPTYKWSRHATEQTYNTLNTFCHAAIML